MLRPSKPQALFRRHIALPSEHGSWVFLLSPLLIGLFAGGRWTMATVYLIVAALAAFLIRQPITTLVKIFSHRRSRQELSAAWFWTAAYGAITLLALAGLILHGFSYLLILAIPGVPVFAWYLYLVSKRAERRQMGVEVVGSGVLALTAPAALWVAVGAPDAMGWWLFALSWFQSAASIVHAYLRLEQRVLTEAPVLAMRIELARRALLYTSFNLLAVIFFSFTGFLPHWLFLPYAVQWLETLWGTFHPAIGLKPTRIGLRQLLVSTLFTLLFIFTWKV
jgi:hypothetical protein